MSCFDKKAKFFFQTTTSTSHWTKTSPRRHLLLWTIPSRHFPPSPLSIAPPTQSRSYTRSRWPVPEPALLTLRRPATTPPPPQPPFVTLTCPVNEIACAVDGRCVPALARCNGVWECSDGSDERDCSSCLPNFRCHSTGRCIPLGLVVSLTFFCQKKTRIDGRSVQMGQFVFQCDGLEECSDGMEIVS